MLSMKLKVLKCLIISVCILRFMGATRVNGLQRSHVEYGALV